MRLAGTDRERHTIEVPIAEYDLILFESITCDNTSFEWVFVSDKGAEVTLKFRQANEDGE